MTPDTAALIARLRARMEDGQHWENYAPTSRPDFLLLDEAATALAHLSAEVERKQAIVDAALEWSSERSVSDWSEADLMKALWTYGGDRTDPCPECDGECGEPCAPCTVAQAHSMIDAQLEQLVRQGKLIRGTPFSEIICPNCDATMPEGCGGVFKSEGEQCLLNRAALGEAQQEVAK
jgi:hypothetical protein